MHDILWKSWVKTLETTRKSEDTNPHSGLEILDFEYKRTPTAHPAHMFYLAVLHSIFTHSKVLFGTFPHHPQVLLLKLRSI